MSSTNGKVFSKYLFEVKEKSKFYEFADFNKDRGEWLML